MQNLLTFFFCCSQGLPYGLLAYAAASGGWKNMLKHYQKSRMLDRSHRAYNSWSSW